MRPKTRAQYVGNTPTPKSKQTRRKGSAKQYRIPSKAKQRIRDKAYIAFQEQPSLNEVTANLRIRQICDTIIGGERVWLKAHRTNPRPNQKATYSFPMIINGERCDQPAERTFRRDGKTIRRCAHHTNDEAWIKEGTSDQ